MGSIFFVSMIVRDGCVCSSTIRFTILILLTDRLCLQRILVFMVKYAMK